jgi:CheY-like chemotaxis protein
VNKIILLAEDNEDHAFLVQAAFERAGFPNCLAHVANGEQAIAYLKGQGPYEDRGRYPLPRLMLLDLKMPVMDGFEVLEWTRNSPEWRHLPITILTTSLQPGEISRAYDLGANSFLTKPADFPEFLEAVKDLCNHWLVRNDLPDVTSPVATPKAATAESPIMERHLKVSVALQEEVEQAWEVPIRIEDRKTRRRSMVVFHINDSTDDQVLFQAACKKANVPFTWQVTDSVERALEYFKSLISLDRERECAWPDLVVLDLHMPIHNGFEVLEFIRATPELRRLPVIVCSGNSDPFLVTKAYQLGANSFLHKPVDFGEITELVSSLFSFWSLMQSPTAGITRVSI